MLKIYFLFNIELIYEIYLEPLTTQLPKTSYMSSKKSKKHHIV